MKCPNCQNEVQEDAIFCDQCGTRLPRPVTGTEAPAAQQPAVRQEPLAPQVDASQGTRCPNCGAMNTPGEMFCGECGTPLSAPQPETASAASAPVTPHEPAGQAATASRTCPDCGATVAEGEQFCYACGAELQAAATSPTPEPQRTTPSESAAPAMPAQAEQAPTPPKEETAIAVNECPACGAKVTPGDAFCEFCGAALIGPQEAVATPATTTAPAPTAPAPASAEPPAAPPATAVQTAPAVEARPAGPRLVVVSNGAEIPLAANKEIIVGREDPYSGIFPDVDLTPHGGEEGGVSRRHFKITAASGQYRIEDLNSTNYTLLNRNRLQPGVPSALKDGDEIRAGRIRLMFKVS